MQFWTNPLTGSDELPTEPGEIISAAVAYWEDQLANYRSRRPRKLEDKQDKQNGIDRASDRLLRYRAARDMIAFSPKRAAGTTLDLATRDLRAVMRAPGGASDFADAA